MTMIHLRHHTHGEKIAHSVGEAKHDKEHGWEEFTPSKPAPVIPLTDNPFASDLPAAFPGREELITAGLLKWASVATKTDAELLEIKGIGPATVSAIRAVLEG